MPEEEKAKQGSQSSSKEKIYTKRNFHKKEQVTFTIPAVFRERNTSKAKGCRNMYLAPPKTVRFILSGSVPKISSSEIVMPYQQAIH